MKKISILLLTLLFLVSGCTPKPNIDVSDTPSKEFETYLDQLLVDLYSPDDFGINFSFVNPEDYGIKVEPYVLGFTSKEDYNEGVEEAKTIIEELKSFDDEDLTLQQQIDKQVIIESLEDSVAMADYYDYEIGGVMLGYSRNVMGSLPAYLETFVFRNQQDVEGYLNLVETMPEYIQKYIDLELIRQNNGTGFGQEEIDEIIKVSNETIADASSDSFYLIAHFNNAIDELNFMDTSAKEAVKTKHAELLKTKFADSYRLVVDALSKIEAKPSTGLVNKPNGKKYYESLIQQETGKKATIKEINKLLDKKETEIFKYFAAHLDVINDWETTFRNELFGNFTDGRELLDFIQDKYTNDFPKISAPNYILRKVDESMEAASSPAFYFTPPVDYSDKEQQVIYINGQFENKLYTTYAHEGMPGHMYQFSYFLTLDEMHPVRSAFSSSANAEGWANYAEKLAVKYVHDEDYAEFYRYYNMYIEILHIRMDIGVNYTGWSFDEFLEFFTGEFSVDLNDEETLTDLKDAYLQFVHTPAAFPTYYLSNIYIQDMKLHAMQELDELYNEVEFHKALLDVGSASMKVMEESVDRYINNTKENSKSK